MFTRSLSVVAAIVGLAFGLPSHATSLDEMWRLIEPLTEQNITNGVEMIRTDSPNVPAQIYITPEKSWIEYSEVWASQHSKGQFDFVIYHEIGHIHLKHQEQYDDAVQKDPTAGDPLRAKFVLESDQFATLAYLKFGRDWSEIEALVREIVDRNATGPGIPPAGDRQTSIQEAHDFFFKKPAN